MGRFFPAVNRRTKLVAIGAASNALGTIKMCGRAGEMAHSLGAQIFVDAVHYAPHELIDVRDWNCDFLACLRLQVLWPAHRNSLRPTRSARLARFSKTDPRARFSAGTGARPAPRTMRESQARPPLLIFSPRSLRARRCANACEPRSGNCTSAAMH